MSAVRRLAAFTFLLTLLAGAVLWITREFMRPAPSYQQRGLRWLKEEYRLDDATFQQVEELHEAYFASCTRMCREIKEASRPLLMQNRRNPLPSATQAGLRRQEHQLCEKCEDAAKTHLHQVASLMPPTERQRFLDDMLTTLDAQRRQHELDLSSHSRR